MNRLLAFLVALLFAVPARGQITLDDLAVPAGHVVVFAALIQATSIGMYDGRTNQSQLQDGELQIEPNLIVNRLRYTSSRIIVNRTGGGFFWQNFLSNTPHRDSTWHLQSLVAPAIPDPASFTTDSILSSDIGGGFMNIRDPGFLQVALNLTNANRLFLFALTEPAGQSCSALGGTLHSLDDIRIGTVQPLRAYQGTQLICGTVP